MMMIQFEISIAGYRYSSMVFCSDEFRHEQHIAFFKVVSRPARSLAFSIVGPLVAFTFAPIAFA